jgi:hypothetical protein
VPQFGAEFVCEFVAGATRAGAERITALDHEPFDHAMENQPVIKRTFGFLPGLRVGEFLRSFRQAGKVGHRVGGMLVE